MNLLARPGDGDGNFRRDESAATRIAEKRRGTQPRIAPRACDPVCGRWRPQSQQRNDSTQQHAPEYIANDAAQRIHLCELVCVVHPGCNRYQPACARPAAPDLPRPCLKLGSRSSVPRSVVNWEKQCQRKVEKMNGAPGTTHRVCPPKGSPHYLYTALIQKDLCGACNCRAASWRPEFVQLPRRVGAARESGWSRLPVGNSQPRPPRCVRQAARIH
jgi:hypothetical protein